MYNGLKMAKHTTIATMKEYVEIIKGLLSGHDFSYKGNFFDFHNFPKLVDKELDIPILFGSSGDKMLKLAGEIADGVILNSIGTEEARYISHKRFYKGIKPRYKTGFGDRFKCHLFCGRQT
jgi:alkanesulfonate monooxygenase SsuD/methylene tetrahydromethanopterin reductase-like flavin-dependent oxidoreductase (luciferase family)